MNKTGTLFISVLIIFTIVSSTTAIPNINNISQFQKNKEINHISIMLKKQIEDYTDTPPNIRISDLTTISDLIGFFYILAGLIGLYYTLLIIMIAFVAITFNPGGYIFFLYALFPAILTTIFFMGGIKLITSTNPLSNMYTIFSLSVVLFITWIILRLKGYPFILLIRGFLHEILDYFYSIIEFIIGNPFLKSNTIKLEY
jgi:hypothetical protein